MTSLIDTFINPYIYQINKSYIKVPDKDLINKKIFISLIEWSKLGETELLYWELKHFHLVYYYLGLCRLGFILLLVSPCLDAFVCDEVKVLSKSKHAIETRQLHLQLLYLHISRANQSTLLHAHLLAFLFLLIAKSISMAILLIQQIVETENDDFL